MISGFTLKSLMDGKALQRAHAKSLREELSRKRPNAAQHAAAMFLDKLPLSKTDIVALYHPTASELDTWPLIEELFRLNMTVCLPIVHKKNAALSFREFKTDMTLVQGRYKIMTPPESADEVIPTIIVCPLLAFTPEGYRLGMGGGYYDRTLHTLRQKHSILSVGYAYADQEANNFPIENHDEKLDWIVTERDAWRP